MRLPGIGIGTVFNKFRGGGAVYTPRVQAFLSATGITDPTTITAIVNLDASLEANTSLNNSIISFHPAVGGLSTTNKYNFMDTALYELTFGGGVTHNSNGFTFNGTNGYAEASGLNLNTLSISEGGTAYYAGTYTDNGGCAYGIRNGSTLFQCFPNLSALNRTYFYVLDATDSFASNSDQSGFFGFHREGGTKYRNINNYNEIKYKNHKWMAVARYNWEQVHGPVPNDMCVFKIDQDKYNLTLYFSIFLIFILKIIYYVYKRTN